MRVKWPDQSHGRLDVEILFTGLYSVFSATNLTPLFIRQGDVPWLTAAACGMLSLQATPSAPASCTFLKSDGVFPHLLMSYLSMSHKLPIT